MNGLIIALPTATFPMEQERDGGAGVLQLNAELTSPDDVQK